MTGQVAELEAAGCVKVFREKVVGRQERDRAELAKVLGRLDSGDVLVVTRLDRLARSTRDLLNVIDAVTKRGAGFKSLKDTWADTTSPHGRLMLTVLGGLAEFERELIRARTGEGRKRARRQIRQAPQADGPSAAGSDCKTLCWRNTGGCSADLQRQPHDHRAPAMSVAAR